MERHRLHVIDRQTVCGLWSNVLSVVVLLAFLVPAAVPHLHGLNGHDAEVCAGHLSHEGAKDTLHAGSCAACSTQRRKSFEAPLGQVTPSVAPELTVPAHHGAPCHNPVRPSGDCEKSRAPPANRLHG